MMPSSIAATQDEPMNDALEEINAAPEATNDTEGEHVIDPIEQRIKVVWYPDSSTHIVWAFQADG